MRPPFPLLLFAYVALALKASAELIIPGISGTPAAGSDGELNINITGTTNIDLGKAPALPWDAVSPNKGAGVYDSNKWAVVFKYSKVTIGPNATVTFKNNATRAPVVWLVTGDVVMDGLINLNGNNDKTHAPQEPGPGGFRGGIGALYNRAGSGGFGPGGGSGHLQNRGANHALRSGIAGEVYGTSPILLLMGGSGGGGLATTNQVTDYSHSTGGAGGGAILIVASNGITINGGIAVAGGPASNFPNGSILGNGGSGGSVRLVADELGGTGEVVAQGSQGSSPGFIRLEANRSTGTIRTTPMTTIISFNPGEPVRIWPPDDNPTTRIVSISGALVPADPKAGIQYRPADLRLPAGSSREVIIETTHFPTNGAVTLFHTPISGERVLIPASYRDGDETKATWRAMLTGDRGHSVLQVRASTK